MSIAENNTILDSASFYGNLNEKLNPECIDVPVEDKSIPANITRGIVGAVSRFFTPRQIIIVLRLVKALTFCFLCLTIAADLMYIFFVELVASKEVSVKLGGHRDLIIRTYGVGLTVMAIMIELDMPWIGTYFAGLKGYLPRSLLLFFVSTLTTTSPIGAYERRQNGENSYSYNNNQYSGGEESDGGLIANQIPESSVVFQMVTSWILGVCACTYFFLGIFCFDRFTSRAFLSEKDPISSTAIPQSIPPSPRNNSSQHRELTSFGYDVT